MNYETKDQLDQNVAVEIEETELETIATAMQVRSGIRAGLAPCL
jgi:hypothetical protein